MSKKTRLLLSSALLLVFALSGNNLETTRGQEMTGRRNNWLVEKLLGGQQRNRLDLGQLRAERRFDPNNQEAMVNDLTSRLSTSPSQRLAIARSLHLASQGLIVGGQRDDADRNTRAGQGFGSAPSAGVGGSRRPSAGSRPVIDAGFGGGSKGERQIQTNVGGRSKTGSNRGNKGNGTPQDPRAPQ